MIFFILKISFSMDSLLKPSQNILSSIKVQKKNTSIKVFLVFAKCLTLFNHRRSFDQKVSVTLITLVYNERYALREKKKNFIYSWFWNILKGCKSKSIPLTFLKKEFYFISLLNRGHFLFTFMCLFYETMLLEAHI